MEHKSESDRIVRVLIQRLSGLARSDDPAERFSTLWVSAMLDERLAGCTDFEIGGLMILVQERFGIFEPEMAVCHHATKRLLLRDGREH